MSESTREPETLQDVAFRAAVLDMAGPLGQESPLAARWPADWLTRVCLHEAAHCAAGFALGKFPTSVTVWRRGAGITRFGQDVRDDEKRLSDAEHVRAVNIVLEDAGEPALDMAAVYAEAEAILERHWRLVEVIAANLTSRLIGEEAATLGRRALELLWEFNRNGESDVSAS